MSDSINPMGILPCSGCMRGNGDSTPCEKWQKCQPSGEARLFLMQGKEEEVKVAEKAEEENCCKKPPELQPAHKKGYFIDAFAAGMFGGGDIYAPDEVVAKSPLDTQVGGGHYKKLGSYQPWEVAKAWLTPEELKGAAKKEAFTYLAREADKGGRQDIEKAVHTLQIYLELTKEQEGGYKP